MSIIGNPFLLFLTSDNKSKQIVAVNYSRHIIFSRFLTAKGNTMQLTVVPNDNVTDGANVYSASMDVLNEHNLINGSQYDDNGNQVTATVTNIDADGTYTLSADSPINGKRVLAMSADEIARRQQASQPQTEQKQTAPQAEQNTQFQEQTEQGQQQSVQTEQQGEQDYETMQPEQAYDKLVADMGDNTIAEQIATAQMEQAKAELEKLQKKAPKLSGTPAEMKQALSEHNAKIAEAQRKLDAWTAINAVPQQRRAEEQKRIREENDRRQAEASAKAVAELEEQKKREAERQADNAEQSTQPKMTEQSEESKIIQPIGESDFGFVYDQFKGDAQGAIRHLTKKQEGEALGALHHKNIGDIDLVWGYAGTRKSDGYGLAKLVKFHPEVLDNLQEIIGNMRVVKRSDNRIQLEDSKYKASVRLSWNGADKTWLLTAFMKKEMSEPTNSSTGVVSNHKGLSDDTATRQSIDISDSKDNELSQKSKEDAEENAEIRLDKFKEIFDKVAKGDNVNYEDLVSELPSLTDEEVYKLSAYGSRKKARSKVAKINLNALFNQVRYEADEREARNNPNGAFDNGYKSGLEIAEKIKNSPNADFDGYIESKKSSVERLVSQGYTGHAEITRGLIQAVVDYKASLMGNAEENAEDKEQQAPDTEKQSDAVEQKDSPTVSIKEIVQRFKKLEKERKELFEKDAFSEQYDEIIFKLKEFLESLTDEQLSKLGEKVGYSLYISDELKRRKKKAEEERFKGAFDTAMQSQG